MKNQLTSKIVILVFSLLSQTAFAQYYMDPSFFSSWAYNNQSREILEEAHQEIFGQSIEESLGRTDSGNAVSTYEGNPDATQVINDLASAYPAGNQADAKNVFGQLYAGYQQIEANFGLPKNDIAGAVAALIAGSYMAYHLVDFPDQNFVTLANQMRVILSRSPELLNATAAQKQEMYQRYAILGTLMAGIHEAIKQNPNTPNIEKIKANLRSAGKKYLESFLQVSADRVQITSKGLVLR